MDVFGDSSLFDEFEKERSSTGSFILYERKEGGDEDRSKIVFQIGDSDESDSSSEDDNNDDVDDHSQKEDDSDEESTDLSRDIPNGILRDTNLVKPTEKQTDYKLLHERNKYQRYARVIDSTRHVPDIDSPCCQIIFQNNSFSRRYRTAIEQYITHLISKDLYENKRRQRLPELNLKSSSLTCVDLNNKLSASQRNNDMWAAHTVLGCSQFHKNFLVDTLGWPLVANNPALTDSWEVPKYEQIFLDALPVSEADGPGKPPQRPKASCFNCGGEHMMSECPQPRDFNKIRENRDKFREQSSSLQRQGSQRYHRDPEAQPELNKFRPGQISEDLREALGISPKQLPPYVYKMRVIGYPPGWLEEAKIQTSGLALFDKHGKEVDVSGESMEDGQVDEVIPNQGEIDPDRIIEYPGFTVPCPDDVIDEHEELNMPAIQEHQLKSTLSSQVASRKRKAEEEEEQIQQRVKKSRKESSQDMDLEDNADELNTSTGNGSFVPPLPVDTPPGRPPLPDGTPPITPNTQERKKPKFPLPGQPPLPFDTPPGRPPIPENTPPPTPESEKEIRNPINRQISEISGKSGRSESPSLEDLEEQYKMLQQRLAEDDDPEGVELLVVDSCEADEEENTQDSSATDILPTGFSRVGSATSINTFGELGTGSPSSSLPGTPIITPGDMTPNSSLNNLNLLRTSSGSLSKDYGTPISHRTGVADCLPDAQKFGEGIEDHIPYENLPEATGTFDKMRGLIDKIRGKLRKKKT